MMEVVYLDEKNFGDEYGGFLDGGWSADEGSFFEDGGLAENGGRRMRYVFSTADGQWTAREGRER